MGWTVIPPPNLCRPEGRGRDHGDSVGQFGVHKFIIGNVGAGVAMLAITLVSWVLSLVIIGIFGVAAMSIIGLIEGIIYLTKSDEEFIVRYGINHKGWF